MSRQIVILRPLTPAPSLSKGHGGLMIYRRILTLIQQKSNQLKPPNTKDLTNEIIEPSVDTCVSLSLSQIIQPQPICSISSLACMCTPQAANNKKDLIEFKEPVDVQLIEHLLSKIEEVSITITDNNKTFSLTNKTGKKSINVGIKSSLSSNNVMCIELTEERSVKVVMKVLYERSIRIVCYDSHLLLMVLLMQYGVTLGNWCIFDLKLADYLLMPDKPSSTFEDLLTRYDANNSHIERNWNLSRQFPLMDLLCHELNGKQLWHLYSNLEMKVSPIIATMECVGLLINRQLLISYCDTLKTKLKNIESNAFELVGHSFSLTSTAQLREVLFNKLELDRKCQSSLQKTVVNKLTSTSEPVLIQLSPHHPLPGMILQYRQLSKLKSLIDSILTHSIDGYLRPNWLHCGSVTGRVCCCNPNMQGFPKQVCHVELQGVVKKKFVTIDVRSCVISRNDHSFVAIDFKSIELRLLAHFSHDDLLCGILSHDSSVDVFQMLASEWFGLSLEDVTSSQREKAKRVVYAIVYGVGKERLAEMLQISIESAYELMKSFLKRFSGVQNWINYCLAECRKTKYCNSLCGRKRWFDGINSADYVARATLERQAVNFIIQGSAADICKITMLKIYNNLSQSMIPGSKLMLQVHDELLYEVPDELVSVFISKLRDIAESAELLDGFCGRLHVPLAVRITSGKSWSSLM